jgi:hypothetical protein
MGLLGSEGIHNELYLPLYYTDLHMWKWNIGDLEETVEGDGEVVAERLSKRHD